MRIISKRYEHLQNMTLTPVKCQRNRHKTVWKVANTRYLVSIHFACKNALVHFIKKKVVKKIEDHSELT